MSYFGVLGLQREPFGTSPDPRFLFLSPTHQIALRRLEITLKLRRGLSVIYGDVGTGKTTLSRALIQTLSSDPAFSFYMILDPRYPSEFQFLTHLLSSFRVEPDARSTMHYKMALNEYLFKTGVEDKKIPVLVVDEGQKLEKFALELLRVLLNYETNEFKLLQVVIFAQMELLAQIKAIPNFEDRISFRYILRPLNAEETSKMIDFRLKVAGYSAEKPLFTEEAVQKIYSLTAGYPRKIVKLCHDALEALLITKRKQVDASLLDDPIVRPLLETHNGDAPISQP